MPPPGAVALVPPLLRTTAALDAATYAQLELNVSRRPSRLAGFAPTLTTSITVSP